MELCNKREGVMEMLLMFQKDLPLQRANTIALAEFRELHDDDECIEELICLPILRLNERI
jgi:hypothetical protein